jgi:FkbM family methyltransferase
MGSASETVSVPKTSPVAQLWSRLRGRPGRAIDESLQGETLGSEYGGYVVLMDRLAASSVIYSFGIGFDLSFDCAMIERLGAKVHAFDPTPRSVVWAREQNVDGLLLHEHGLLDYDGVVRFHPPKNPDHISHSVLDESTSDRITSQGAIELPVKRLHTVMAELGHERIDVLKMDIEGAEYTVIDHLVKNPLPIGQLLLEFHHMLPGIAVKKTERAIDQLAELGFVPFAVSKTGREWSFAKR